MPSHNCGRLTLSSNGGVSGESEWGHRGSQGTQSVGPPKLLNGNLDGSGELVSLERVDTLGPADGSSVQSIGRTYDDIGRLDKVTSYASSTGTGTIANEIQQLYEPLHGSVKEVAVYCVC